jgi:hypothetical protein
MGESFEDKYQSLLTTIDGLNFNDGAYLLLCNALKKIKESCDEVIIKVINIYLEFEIQGKNYTIFVVQQESVKIDGKKIDYLRYSIKSESRQFEFKKEDVEGIEHIKKYLQHAVGIRIINNFDDKAINFTLYFKNLNELKLYYSDRDKDECIKCNDGEGEECEKGHGISARYSLIKLFNIVD